MTLHPGDVFWQATPFVGEARGRAQLKHTVIVVSGSAFNLRVGGALVTTVLKPGCELEDDCWLPRKAYGSLRYSFWPEDRYASLNQLHFVSNDPSLRVVARLRYASSELLRRRMRDHLVGLLANVDSYASVHTAAGLRRVIAFGGVTAQAGERSYTPAIVVPTAEPYVVTTRRSNLHHVWGEVSPDQRRRIHNFLMDVFDLPAPTIRAA